jgi:NitT/TauT family transport system substrate-binding protein
MSVSGLLGAALAIFIPASGRAEVSEIVLARQYGLHYLPLVLMEHYGLIEKHAKKAGLDLKADWRQFSGGAAVNEALIAGSVHLVSGGVGPLITIWDKTRGNADVRGVAAVSDVPMTLITRNPNVKRLEDFTDQDRIALPAVKVSMQAVTLQMAAAKIYGEKNFEKLDSLTVSMSHPDAAAALSTGVSGVSAHFTAPPYTYSQLKQPNVRKVVDSFEIYGGPATLIVLYTRAKFLEENPKTYAAILAAMEDAMTMIGTDRGKAMEAYIKQTGEKYGQDVLQSFVGDKQISYQIAPRNVLPVAQFMHKIGRLKNEPKSWQELFFPPVHARAGS